MSRGTALRVSSVARRARVVVTGVATPGIAIACSLKGCKAFTSKGAAGIFRYGICRPFPRMRSSRVVRGSS